ncbi:hypothetical protein CEE37_02625 [candidate division LCP-89 bacterium B3_LCP]|uniref:Response regulatory domain-containing protein n=1 Tax=candidate division LCP-89 bacterium B3_LCP TaxID=2012998 RepID=A0A532V2M4_UNCL8|nr:MAG: hypothetical protein CEE37_02625 [candidate division LCP-89 bacterium B3_LCP]
MQIITTPRIFYINFVKSHYAPHIRFDHGELFAIVKIIDGLRIKRIPEYAMNNPELTASAQTEIDLPRKVLIIDDEEAIRTLLKEYIGIIGLDVHTAATGSDGIKALKEDAFGLIICDVSMPGMDGFEVYEKILKLKPDQNFLFITGYSFEGSRQYLIDRSLGLLRKPFHLEDLNTIINGIYPDVLQS